MNTTPSPLRLLWAAVGFAVITGTFTLLGHLQMLTIDDAAGLAMTAALLAPMAWTAIRISNWRRAAETFVLPQHEFDLAERINARWSIYASEQLVTYKETVSAEASAIASESRSDAVQLDLRKELSLATAQLAKYARSLEHANV